MFWLKSEIIILVFWTFGLGSTAIPQEMHEPLQAQQEPELEEIEELPELQEPDGGNVAIEQARLLEQVDRDYLKALDAYLALIMADRKPSVELLEKGSLGAARCLMKLGRYDEARLQLQGLLVGSSVREEAKEQAKKLIASVERLGADSRRASASSVDNLVWQLLDAAAGADDARAKFAESEIAKMGDLASPVLKEAALDPDYYRSLAAFTILARIGEKDSLSFLESCARDPDVALRKRCLDGYLRSKVVDNKRIPILMIFLSDKKEPLRTASLASADQYLRKDYVHTLPFEQQASLADKLLEIYNGKDPKHQKTVFNCFRYWATMIPETAATKVPPHFVTFVEIKLDEYQSLNGLDRDQYKEFYNILFMAYILGTRCGETRLLDQAAGLWPDDFSTISDARDSYQRELPGQFLEAALASGPEALEAIAKKVLSRGDTLEMRAFVNYQRRSKGPQRLPSTSYVAFKALPREYQLAILRPWLSAETETGWGFLQEKWSPEIWSAAVEALLENPNEAFREQALANTVYCPDPENPACFEALCNWASHPDLRTYDMAFDLIRKKLLKEGSIDPGPEGALGIAQRVLGAAKDTPVIRKDRDGDFIEVESTVDWDVAHLVNECLKYGADLSVVQAWLLNQQRPGILEVAVSHGDLRRALIANTLEYALELWPRLGPVGKEVLFEGIFEVLVPTLHSAKNEWLIPLFRGWELDPAWKVENLKKLVSVFLSINNPIMAERIKELVVIAVDTPEMQDHSQIKYLANLLNSLPPENEALLEVLPVWYQGMRSNYSSFTSGNLRDILCASASNLRRALAWLAEDYSSEFKGRVISAICSGEEKSPDFYKSLDLNGGLIRAWSKLDRDIRNDLLVTLAYNTETIQACAGFLVFILLEDSEPDQQHLAYAALWRSGSEEAATLMVDYAGRIDPESREGPLMGYESYDGAILRATEKCFEEVQRRWRSYLAAFPPNAIQHLCLGMLSLPDGPVPFGSYLGEFLKVECDSDLEVVLTAFAKVDSDWERSKLLDRAVSYLLRNLTSRPPDEGNRGQPMGTFEIPVQARELLTGALAGAYSKEQDSEFLQIAALELIGQHRLTSLVPQVGPLVTGHPDITVRRTAVNCLGRFLTMETVPFLLECLKSEDADIRKDASAILERLQQYQDQREAWTAFLKGQSGDGTPESPEAALIELLKSEDPDVRLYAIKALGKLAEPSCLPVLVEMMAKGSPEEREAAKAAIDAITDEN